MSAAELAVRESVVPDSIEPYVGFKYLRILSDGTLLSTTGDMSWPWRRRAEAKCEIDHQFAWHIVSEATAETIWEWGGFDSSPPSQFAGVTGVMVAGSYNVFTGCNFEGPSVAPEQTAPVPPPLILPRGYGWRWQASKHDPAEDACSCGIYLADSKDGCNAYAASGKVLVEVALWGRVVVGESGARGQYAYPQKVFAPAYLGSAAEAASEAYGIPVEIEPDDTFAKTSFELPDPAKKKSNPFGVGGAIAATGAALAAAFGAVFNKHSLYGLSVIYGVVSALLMVAAIVWWAYHRTSEATA